MNWSEMHMNAAFHTECMSHVTHMNESCHTQNESCHTYEVVNESFRTCGWVMSHMWVSHVTHVGESCHTHPRHFTYVNASYK